MDSTERVNVRCSVVIFRDGAVLLLRRDRAGNTDWVLPGGTPEPNESVESCARREVAEETGLQVSISRVAFVLEASNRATGVHVLDLVFTAAESDRSTEPIARESALTPVFQPLSQLSRLKLRPPVAGHLRALHGRGGRGTGVYLGNVWRPDDAPFSAADAPATPMPAGDA